MNRNFGLTTLAAIGALLTAAASVSAEEGTLTRDDVRAELADARAQGLLERAGELATPDTLVQARDWANATQARVLTAKLELQQRHQQRQAVAGVESGITTYTEAGVNGEPVLVVLVLRRDGSISEVRSVQLAALR